MLNPMSTLTRPNDRIRAGFMAGIDRSRHIVAPAEALARLREEVQDAPPAWRAAQRALERFVASPAAAGLLAPRRFDPTTLVAV